MNIYISSPDIPLDKPEQKKLGLYLLDYALDKEYSAKRGEILFGEHGKPYFAGSDIHFNYSHCKYGAACIVAKQAVGVDIQELRTLKPAVIKRVCCDNELKTIKDDADFIKIWVQKEAYAKFTGKGFAENFKTIDTTTFPPEFVFSHDNLYIAYYTVTFNYAVTPQLVQVLPP